MKIKDYFSRHLTAILFLAAFLILGNTDGAFSGSARPAYGAKIHEAIRNGLLPRVRAMVRNDPSLANLPDEKGNPPLHLAIFNNNLPMMKILVEAGADVNAANKELSAMSLHIVGGKGTVEMAKYLLEKGANLEAKAVDGSTPLHLSAMMGNVGVMKIILDRGADINAKTEDNITLLDTARHEKKKEMVTFLKNHGAQEKSHLSYLIALAIVIGSVGLLIINAKKSKEDPLPPEYYRS